MKSILLYANEDKGVDQRLDAAFCLSSQFECLVDCVQVTPYDAFIMADPFGGIYGLPTVAEKIDEDETAHRSRIEDLLKRQRVRWEWQHYEGHPGHVLIERSQLADLAIVSLPDEGAREPVSMAAGLAIHSRTPVLAIPVGGTSFTCNGDAMIAWDGSPEAAYALRCAVPLLKHASDIHVVTIARGRNVASQTEAIHYLLQHGIHAEGHDPVEAETTVAAALVKAADRYGADFVVAGVNGHPRLRSAILGGATTELIAKSKCALLLAH